MAIRLNSIRPTTEVEKALERGYLYKDILFDLNFGYTANKELYRGNEKRDLEPIYDGVAIITSLKNILTTSPGEKLLNPTFGLDLRDYLFEPVSEAAGYFLGRDIYEGLSEQEPRINVTKVLVEVNEEEQEYNINVTFSVPSLNINNLSLKGVLNNDGYLFV